MSNIVADARADAEPDAKPDATEIDCRPNFWPNAGIDASQRPGFDEFDFQCARTNGQRDCAARDGDFSCVAKFVDG